MADETHAVEAGDAFSRVSGLPPEYFEGSAQRFPSSDMSALRVFLALRTAARRVDNVAGGWLERSDMTLTKFDVLHLLAAAQPAGTTVGQLSEHLKMTQPNVTFVMQALERDGFAVRSSDPRDRRSSIFSISPAGLACVERLTPPQLTAIGTALRELSESERLTLLDMLARVAEGFEKAGRP